MTFADFLQKARDARWTLTVYGDCSESALADLRRFFEAQNVHVRVADPEPEAAAAGHPDAHAAGTVTLSDGEQVVATGSLAALLDYVEVDPELPSDGPATEVPDVVAAAKSTVTAFERDGRRHLVRGSQVIEDLAWQNQSGTLHAGFQTFSRLVGFERTRTVFRRLAENGVDVHVYGAPDVDLPADAPYTVHPRDDAEMRHHWFVVYRCPDTGECAALVARLVDADTYSGFWTRDPAWADPVLDYVEQTYAKE